MEANINNEKIIIPKKTCKMKAILQSFFAFFNLFISCSSEAFRHKTIKINDIIVKIGPNANESKDDVKAKKNQGSE